MAWRFDLIWLAFVGLASSKRSRTAAGALVARHTAYMVVNVTTYEACPKSLRLI